MFQLFVSLLLSLSFSQDINRFIHLGKIPLKNLNAEITAALQLHNDSIILGGHVETYSGGCFVQKIGSSGATDLCFGDQQCRRGGRIEFKIPQTASREKFWRPNRSCFVTNLVEQKLRDNSKRILVLGRFYGNGSSYDLFLARFFLNGQRDLEFGSVEFTHGSEFAKTVGAYIRAYPTKDDSEKPLAIRITSEGNLLILMSHFSAGPDRLSLLELKSDGTNYDPVRWMSVEVNVATLGFELPPKHFVFDTDQSFLMAGSWRDETTGVTRFLIDADGFSRDGNFGHYYKSRAPELMVNQKSPDFRGMPGLVKNDFTKWHHLDEGLDTRADANIVVIRELGFGAFYFNKMNPSGDLHQIIQPTFKIGDLDEVNGIKSLKNGGLLIYGHYSSGSEHRVGLLKLDSNFEVESDFNSLFKLKID